MNALISKSPTLTSGLNYLMQVEGYSLQMVSPGGRTDPPNSTDYGAIEIPTAYADSPETIVATLAHEVGHALWGDPTLPFSADVASMSESDFVTKDRASMLQGEGVATLMNIAVADQIWGTDVGHVMGTYNVQGAQSLFDSAFAALAPGASNLNQEASVIGSFYGWHESPGSNPNETYNDYYLPYARSDYEYFKSHYHQLLMRQRGGE